MILITMYEAIGDEARADVVKVLRGAGFQTHTLLAAGAPIVGATGRTASDSLVARLRLLPGVIEIIEPHKPYVLTDRIARPNGSIVQIGDVAIGCGLVVAAGTCAIEDRATTLSCARAVKRSGATLLRGGAFKPRTSPYTFQGLGERGLQILAKTREVTGLPVVTEVMEPEQVDLVATYADMLQIGARNMSNYPLLRRAAATGKPILLKRGFSATLTEWLLSAEYILAGGNDRVVLCERGVRSFDPAVRFMLDLNAVPLLKLLTHLPVIVDPSHGTGNSLLVPAMARAAVAAGADGLLIEVHPQPSAALCDGDQSVTPATFAEIMHAIRAIADALPQQT